MVERCPDKTEVDGPIPSTLTENYLLRMLHYICFCFIITESLGAFIFMDENNKDLIQENTQNSAQIQTEFTEKNWWKLVLIFYAKTTGWIVFPLFLAFLAVFLGRSFNKASWGQGLFLIFIIIGFIVTCFGIYREIKIYKKKLEKNDGK